MDVIRVRPESGRSDLSPLCCHLMDFLRQETISFVTSPSRVFNFVFKSSIPLGAIMKINGGLAFH